MDKYIRAGIAKRRQGLIQSRVCQRFQFPDIIINKSSCSTGDPERSTPGSSLSMMCAMTTGTPAFRIVQLLEEDIIFGRLAPRERLVEDALMKRFDAKRHVVRQALTALERLQIVSREQNKGACVRDFSVRDIEEIFELRALLQRHAAERIPLPAPRRLIGTLRDIHRDHLLAIDAGDLRSVLRLNNQFHDALFAACGNQHLAEAISKYAALSHVIRSYRIANPVLLDQAAEEHDAMIAALERGDRKGLVKLCVNHILPAKNVCIEARRLVDPEWSRDHDRSTLHKSRGPEFKGSETLKPGKSRGQRP